MRWQPLGAPPSTEQLCEMFDLDPTASIGPELAVLSEKTKSSIANLGDHALRQALSLLDSRISQLEKHLTTPELPEEVPLNLSLEGMDLLLAGHRHPLPTPEQRYAGVHLVLPDQEHFLIAASITDLAEDRIGLRFADMGLSDARRMTRAYLKLTKLVSEQRTPQS